ncbi:predicted protein, partial [Naegleria gruberi]
NSSSPSSVDIHEVNKFSLLARTNEWWNPNGALKTLHHINPTRMEYIRSQIVKHFNISDNTHEPLKGLNILDVGCGGGLVSECLARLGANVTGLDASLDNINIARTHNTSLNNLNYIHSTVENLLYNNESTKFDCIVSVEVIEHVAHAQSFVHNLSKLLKPNGFLILSTMNRTPKSYLYTIVMAEYVLNLVPRGTHEWRKYVTPQEMVIFMNQANVKLYDVQGMEYNPLLNKAFIEKNTEIDVNYFITGVKQE